MRAEVNAYNKEITRVYQYIQEKCKSYANHNIKAELLVPSRNILENLLLTAHLARDPPFLNEPTKYTIDPDKIRGVFEDISFKINQFIVLPVFSKRTPNSPSRSAVTTPRSVDAKGMKMGVSPRNKVEMPSV
jgi:hypothetical protein